MSRRIASTPYIDFINDIEKGFEEATSGKYKANYLSEQDFTATSPERIKEYVYINKPIIKQVPVQVIVKASTGLIVEKIAGWLCFISLLWGFTLGFKRLVKGHQIIKRGIWPIRWDEEVITETTVWSGAVILLVTSLLILVIGVLIYWHEKNHSK